MDLETLSLEAFDFEETDTVEPMDVVFAALMTDVGKQDTVATAHLATIGMSTKKQRMDTTRCLIHCS